MNEHVTNEPGGGASRHARKIVRIFSLVLAGTAAMVLFAALFGWLVRILWNWVMPAIFGLPAITFWQAFGVLLLAKLLFGGFSPGSRSRSGGWGHRFRNRNHGGGAEGEGDAGEGPMPGDGRRWPLFRQFWREEGRTAFEAYVQKKKSQDGK